MTLSEIETILEELAVRHQNLTIELLTTILRASNWEDKYIQDAIALFKQKEQKRTLQEASKASTPLVSQHEITFYNSDGQEEELHPILEEVSTVRRDPVATKTVTPEEKQAIIEQVKKEEVSPSQESEETTEEKQELVAPVYVAKKEASFLEEDSIHDEKNNTILQTVPPAPLSQPSVISHEEESLIKEESTIKANQKPNPIPPDLPLLPFESSPHVWSFARYKNVFHAEDAVPEEEVRVIEQNRKELRHITTKETDIEELKKDSPHEDVEIIIEKTPMTREDESLVFLAGVMLLAIILILGYMYSNGRL